MRIPWEAVLQDELEEKERHTWRERALLAVNAAFPHAKYETWPQCERLLSQALFVTQSIEQDQVRGEEAGRLFHETASYLQDHARYSETEPLFQRALHIREQQLGPEHPDVATSLSGLANLYLEQDKYAEAEPLYQRALRIREQQLGPEHPETAVIIHDLAQFQEAQGNSEEVKILYARALAVREKAFGRHHPKTMEIRTRFIALLRTMGQYEEAAQLESKGIQPEP